MISLDIIKLDLMTVEKSALRSSVFYLIRTKKAAVAASMMEIRLEQKKMKIGTSDIFLLVYYFVFWGKHVLFTNPHLIGRHLKHECIRKQATMLNSTRNCVIHSFIDSYKHTHIFMHIQLYHFIHSWKIPFPSSQHPVSIS